MEATPKNRIVFFASKLTYTLFFLCMLAFLPFANVQSSTVYETPLPPKTTFTTDFTDGVQATDFYPTRVFFNATTTFDRVQISVPYNATTTARAFFGVFTYATNTDPRTCNDASCINTVNDIYFNSGNAINSSLITSGTLNFLLGSSTTFYPQNNGLLKSLYISFDPNPTFQKISFNADLSSTSNVYIENGFNQFRTQGGMTLRLCNGSCDENSFPLVETPTQPTTQTPKNIEIINPTYGTTTATTTFNVTISYKTPFSIDFRPTTTRYFEIVDAVTYELNYQYGVIIPANSAENRVISLSATTSEGSKFIRAMYLDINGNIYSEVDEVFFNVATNTYKKATGLDSPRDNPSGLSQIDCSLFDIGCQFQKAIVFLFIPPENSLDKWGNLWQGIQDKVPFGYFTVTKNALTNLDNSGSTAFNLGNIPFIDEIFTPFRTLMAGILWGIYAIYFYQRRLIHLDI